MRVLVASSEIYPYAKTGGLADFSHSLLRALEKLGVEARGIMPLYKSVDRKGFGIEPTGEEIWVNLGGREYRFSMYTDGRNYFLYNEELFDRDHIYGPPGQGYHDNYLRFGGFCWAVSLMVKDGYVGTDVIHSNDWQTALIPLITKEVLKLSVKNVFTIHNLAYQGVFGKETFYMLNLPHYLFNPEALEFWGDLNLMKAGIVFSERITTVSPSYASEIQTPLGGFGLDGLLRRYAYKLRGILNGIDYEVWDPKTDKYIYFNYSEGKGKDKNKRRLCEELGLNPERPLFAFINRFTHQKGIELVIGSMGKLALRKANFLFLGSGEYESALKELSRSYENVRIFIGFDEVLARRVYAAADFILMPSMFEPCGITQIIGMRYGCIPVVRETGGLRDTVIDLWEEGYGIRFKNPTEEEFLCAVDRAVELYHSKRRFTQLRRRVMGLDFSSERMAKEYIQVYKECLAS